MQYVTICLEALVVQFGQVSDLNRLAASPWDLSEICEVGRSGIPLSVPNRCCVHRSTACMYEHFYGLNSDPFRLSPTGRSCYEHETYRRARSYLLYALGRREGVYLLTGLPGTGKTTLIRQTVRQISDASILLVDIVVSRLGEDDVVDLIAARFGCTTENTTRAKTLQNLEQRLRDLRAQGRHSVLIMDEAQGLTAGALEEIRGLTNLEAEDEPLLQIILVGQPPLLALVQTPALEQLHQRIVAACELSALAENEIKPYVEHCLQARGWKDNPKIADGIYPIVYRESLGVPRRINLLCSRLFLRGMVNKLSELNLPDIKAVLKDLREEGLLLSNDSGTVSDRAGLAL